MKKLATYIMAGFLSVGVASPTFSMDCDFIESKVSGLIFSYGLYEDDMRITFKEKRDGWISTYETAKKSQNELLPHINALTNAHSSFCK